MFRFRAKESEHDRRSADNEDPVAGVLKPGARTLTQHLASSEPISRDDSDAAPWLVAHELDRVLEQGHVNGAPVAVARKATIRAADSSPGPERSLPGELRTLLEDSYGVDLGPLRILEDGVPDQLGVIAAARGNEVHFARGVFDPSTEEGRWVIAHEVAHAVQQGMADATSSAAPTLARSPHFEREAELAAAAALSGARAQLSRGASVAFMGFDSYEHKQLGDAVTGGRRYGFAGGFVLTHGDLLMLNGDFFDVRPDAAPKDNLFVIADRPSTKPGTQLGTQDEVIAALKESQKTAGSDPRFGRGGIWEHLVITPEVKDAMTDRYKRLALTNREHFVEPKEGETNYDRREGASGSYRDMHQWAIRVAYEDGKQGLSVDHALAIEACGQHFFTDAFSAGHMRTPRASLQAYWDYRHPKFKPNLKKFIGEQLGNALVQQDGLVGLAVAEEAGAQWLTSTPFERRHRDPYAAAREDLVTAALAAVEYKLGATTPGLGDLLSSVFHDVDNENGLEVINDLGWTWTAYGDDHLSAGQPSKSAGGRTHFEIIKLGIELGCADIVAAHHVGARGIRMSDVDLYEYVKTRSQAQVHDESTNKFAPERIMPRPNPESKANGTQNWKADTLELLLDKPIHTRSKETVRQGIKKSLAPGGTYRKALLEQAHDLNEDFRWLHLRLGDAFLEGVIAPLVRDPIGTITAVAGPPEGEVTPTFTSVVLVPAKAAAAETKKPHHKPGRKKRR